MQQPGKKYRAAAAKVDPSRSIPPPRGGPVKQTSTQSSIARSMSPCVSATIPARDQVVRGTVVSHAPQDGACAGDCPSDRAKEAEPPVPISSHRYLASSRTVCSSATSLSPRRMSWGSSVHWAGFSVRAPDAESKAGTVTMEWPRRHGDQGRQDRVPGRQDRQCPRADRKVCSRVRSWPRTSRHSSTRSSRQALGIQGDLSPVRYGVQPMVPHQARHGGIDEQARTSADVDTLTEQIKASPNIIVTDFSGLNVLKLTEFRRRLRATGAQYVVVKNTLAQRALAANAIGELDDQLTGTTGFVFAGTDPMGAAKVLGEFAKEHERPP